MARKMSTEFQIKDRSLIADTVRFVGSVSIGDQTKIHDWSILGFSNRNPDEFQEGEDRTVKIGSHCIIYPWVLIYEGAVLGNRVEIHDRCAIGSHTHIGDQSLILYGAQVHDNVTIGSKCIVAGFVADNCTIGDGSSVFGSLVHRYENPGREDWDQTDEVGPTLGRDVVVGWGAVVAGPVTIGDRAWIAPNSVVRNDVAAGARYVDR